MLDKDFDKIAKQMDAVFDHADQTFKAMDKTFKTIEQYADEVMGRAAESAASWEKWFAWHPVKVNGKRVWMKTVYRKYSWVKSTEQPFGTGYDYGTIFDVLKNANN